MKLIILWSLNTNLLITKIWNREDARMYGIDFISYKQKRRLSCEFALSVINRFIPSFAYVPDHTYYVILCLYWY
jgi:hypothetical protein